MADTTFVSKVTHIMAAWLNDVNKAVYRAIGVGGVAPTTPAEVRDNLGLSSTTGTTGATLIGMTQIIGAGNNVQAYINTLSSTIGSEFIGAAASGDLAGATVEAQLNELDTEKASLLHGNNWAGASGNGGQKLEYTVPAAGSGVDHVGWQALVHKDDGGNTDNVVGIVSHVYHDGNFDSPNGIWGFATEAWSNPTNYATLIGGEVSVISQCPTMANPSIGLNAVFKNRLDIASNPTAPVVDGSEYNYNSTALFVSSQARPSGAGAAWAGVGSGWQTAIRIGDLGYGSGLDWEGGSFFPGSATKKAYTTIIDMTNALTDLAGGTPWFTLYRNADTFWGMRFNGTLTGQLETYNIVPNAGGAGYVVGDRFNITSGGGAGGTGEVRSVLAGAVTSACIVNGGSGYVVTAGATTTATTGVGAGLTLDITLGTGLIYGANLGVTAGGAGYIVGEIVSLDGGTAGYMKPFLQVTAVTAGAVTAFELLTAELIAPTNARTYSIGRGHTVGAGKATTTITGTGAGFTVSVAVIHNDLLIGGERWEFWRMLNPSNPTSSGARHGFIDSSFPGTPLTIDTSGATYTFPIDRPL